MKKPPCSLRISALVTLIVCEVVVGQIAVFPYAESFEGGLGDWNSLPPAEDRFEWISYHQDDHPRSEAPAAAYAGSYYTYAQVVSFEAITSRLESPFFHLTDLLNPRLSFWCQLREKAGLSVEISAANAPWQALWHVDRDQGDQWQQVAIDLSAYLESTIRICFVGHAGSLDGGGAAHVALDDIAVTEGSPLISGTIVTWSGTPIPNLSVQTQWGGGSGQTDASGYYFLTLPDNWTGRVIPDGSHFGFAPIRRFYEDLASSVASQDYRTVPRADFPYVQSFEDGWGQWLDHPRINHGWQRRSGATLDGTPSQAAEGRFYLRTFERSTSDVDVVVEGPAFDLRSLHNPQFVFWHYMHDDHVGDLRVEVSSDAGGTWTSIWSLSGIQPDQWQEGRISLAPYALSRKRCQWIPTARALRSIT